MNPGDWIAADEDGVVIIPSDIASQVIEAAWAKMFAENKVRDAVTTGMSTTEAFRRFGVL